MSFWTKLAKGLGPRPEDYADVNTERRQQTFDEQNNWSAEYDSNKVMPPVQPSQVMAPEAGLLTSRLAEAAGPAYPSGGQEIDGVTSTPKYLDMAVRFLEKNESFSKNPYPDAKGQNANGFGTSIDPRHGEPVNFATAPISQSDARDGLTAHLAGLEQRIAAPEYDILNDNQRAGVLSMMYNMGPDRVLNSKMMDHLLVGDMEKAKSEMMGFVRVDDPKKQGGILNRRLKEWALMSGEDWENLDKPGLSAARKSVIRDLANSKAPISVIKRWGGGGVRN